MPVKTMSASGLLPAHFRPGRGSFLNESGEVEMDASVMEGGQLAVGAVAAIRNFLHPGRIALDVMRHTPHALLVGEGAEDFAAQRGHVRLAPEELVCERERAVFASWIAAGRPDAKVFFAEAAESHAGKDSPRRGTVGVVVGLRNGEGVWRLYCGTRFACGLHEMSHMPSASASHPASTGGTPGKRKGRVGDVPVVGGGFYADDETVAVSCTGWGEGLMRMSAAHMVSSMVRAGQPLQAAVEAMLASLLSRLGGRAGIIAVDRHGHLAAAYTTPYMGYAGPAVCIRKI
jgi:L-asparaginase / beta-aspartyl-peptidase